MNPAHTFTEKQFHAEILEFRNLFGSKTWWEKTKAQRDACIGGLAFMYLNLVNEDGSLPAQEQIDKWAMTFDSTISEYNRRAIMLGKIE